ncbi:DUF2085 domain-containing protein [Clostridium hominis]
MDNIKDKIWLTLMNLFSNSCHQKAERSFFINKYQFPICARCTGLLLGYFLGVLIFIFIGEISFIFNVIFILIMFIDWFIQHRGIKISNNLRRLFTGSLCGIGVIGVLVNIYFLLNKYILRYFDWGRGF